MSELNPWDLLSRLKSGRPDAPGPRRAETVGLAHQLVQIVTKVVPYAIRTFTLDAPQYAVHPFLEALGLPRHETLPADDFRHELAVGPEAQPGHPGVGKPCLCLELADERDQVVTVFLGEGGRHAP